MFQRLILFLLRRGPRHFFYSKLNFYFFVMFFQVVKLLLLGGILQYWFYNYTAVYRYYGMNFLSLFFGGSVLVGAVAAVFALTQKSYRSLKYIGALIAFPICFYSIYGATCIQYIALYWIVNSILKSYVTRPVLAYSRLSAEFSPKLKGRQKYIKTNSLYKADQNYLAVFDSSLIRLKKDVLTKEEIVTEEKGVKLKTNRSMLHRTFRVKGYLGTVTITDDLDVAERARYKHFRLRRNS